MRDNDTALKEDIACIYMCVLLYSDIQIFFFTLMIQCCRGYIFLMIDDFIVNIFITVQYLEFTQ